MPDNTGNYITIQQVRDAGVTVGQASDPEVTAAIALAMQTIDRGTGQWFNSRALTIAFEGKNSNVLMLGVPILEIDEIKLNGESVPTPLVNFVIFNSRTYPDDRRNPRIKIMRKERNIYTDTIHKSFHRGAITQIIGKFGFLEQDGSTPLLIQRATLKLAIKYATTDLVNDVAQAGTGPMKRERTDLHEVEYFEPSADAVQVGSGFTGDDEVDKIISMYRAPVGIGGSILDTAKIETVEGFDIDPEY